MRADWQSAVSAALARLDTAQWGRRLWDFDPTLWPVDEARGEHGVPRLGWLAVIPEMQARLDELRAFVDDVRAAGFTHAVVCDMGGSGIVAELFRTCFGVQPGYVDLLILDTTDPATVAHIDAGDDPAHTLFILAADAGDSVEMQALFAHEYARVQGMKGERAGENFVAITAPGSSLEALAATHRFRRTFLHRADIAAPYSALSYAGLVPAALLGVDVARLLARAQAMAQQCGPEAPTRQNPGLALGATLGALGLAGVDKVTLVSSVQIAPFGVWWEHLIAASTGKAGVGLVPVAGEPVGTPAAYGDDRCFAYLRLPADTAQDMAVQTLDAVGYPVRTYALRDVYDIGAQIFLWQFAVAVAAALLGVDPFAEPDVWETEAITAQLLADYTRTGTVAEPAATVTTEAIAITGGEPGETVTGLLARFLRHARPGSYVDFAAYTPRDAVSATALLQMRVAVRDATRVATTTGFGPRCLYTTGQLHKGGPNSGLFVQIVPAVSAADVPIPGAPYSFGTLTAMRALADLHAYYLPAHRRSYPLRVYLRGDVTVAWRELTAAVTAAVQAAVAAV